jgi:hypothetical protein
MTREAGNGSPLLADPVHTAIYEEIYRTDLVYVRDCWKLCGDAHCCNFSRYKKRFRMIARTPFQELPLLPGEYEFMRAKGWDTQFGEFEHKVIEFPLDDLVLRVESIVSLREGCACDHATRPTICRLYPLLPVFDAQGQLSGTEPIGIYEELERIGGLAPACQLTTLPFDQLQPFLTMTSALSRSPLLRFYLEAYRRTKRHVALRLDARAQASPDNIWQVFEGAFLRRTLTDAPALRDELNALARAFTDRYGTGFAG